MYNGTPCHVSPDIQAHNWISLVFWNVKAHLDGILDYVSSFQAYQNSTGLFYAISALSLKIIGTKHLH